MEVLARDYTEFILRNNPAERFKGAVPKSMSGLQRGYSSPDGACCVYFGKTSIWVPVGNLRLAIRFRVYVQGCNP